MSYLEEQRRKAIGLRDKIFKDPGGGIYKNIGREFVLTENHLNLLAGIREDAIHYFTENKIPFWDKGASPTGHLLSSQIACLNHLFFMRQREDIATEILRAVDSNVKSALRLNNGNDKDGFVDFEVIGKDNYLGEKCHTRGANSTSIDAVMLAEMNNGNRKLFLIEWKYVESYGNYSKATDKGGATRLKIYSSHLNEEGCPIKNCNLEGLFTEPYYQLMRQTLLAHNMIKAGEYSATDYMHLHIIPKSNKELLLVNTAAGKLSGNSLTDTWSMLLKSPHKYKVIDPADFLKPAEKCPDTKTVISYLRERYWDQ